MNSSSRVRSQHNLAVGARGDRGAASPTASCIIFRDRRFTYADVTDRTRRLAHVLHDRGLGARPAGRVGLANHESHHDHVAIYAYNGNEYLEAMVGAFKARVAPINVNYKYVAEELRYVLQDSAAKAIVFHSSFAPTLTEVLPDLPDLRVLLQIADDSGNDLLPGAEWYEETLAAASGDLPPWADDWSPDDLYILYTGGTTGMPKGVLWRQADIHRTAMAGRDPVTGKPWASLDAIAEAAVANPAPHTTIPAAPLMHGGAQWAAFAAMNSGGTVVIQDEVTRFDAADLCRVIDREHVTYLQIIGDAFARPIIDETETGRHDLSSLRVLLSGGAALAPQLKERFLARLPQLMIIEGLGSSEGGGQGIQITKAGGPVSSGTFDVIDGSVLLSSDLTTVVEPGDDQVGWLAKRGDDVPLGYLDDAAKTARTFPVVAGKRMSVPGDRARWGADGTIELLGRDSVTINSGGEKIFAEEVEAAISAHPDVYDVVVAPRPSERWGQEVTAIVQLRDGAVATEADLASEASRHVARYKLPKAWVFVDGHPPVAGRQGRLPLGERRCRCRALSVRPCSPRRR